MSTINAFVILLSVLAAIVLVVLVFIFRWEPASLIFWRNITLLLVVLLLAVPAMLPPAVRWGGEASIFKAILAVLLLAIGIKALIIFMRHGSVLTPAQKTAAYITLVPLAFGVLLAAGFFLFVWLFSRPKG